MKYLKKKEKKVKKLKKGKTSKQPVQNPEEIRTKDFFDCVAPGVVKFFADSYLTGDSYRSAWVVKEYPPSTEEQAILSQLAERNGVTLRIYHRPIAVPLMRRRYLPNRWSSATLFVPP